MKKIKLIVIQIFLMISIWSLAETDECSHPQHPVKRLICTDQAFNDLYKQMTALVDRMNSVPELGQDLEASQEYWFTSVSQTCAGNNSCYKNAFADRMSVLNQRVKSFEEERKQTQNEFIKFIPGMLQKNVFDGAEVVLISGYSAYPGAGLNGGDFGRGLSIAGARVTGQANVNNPKVELFVDRPGSNVVLVLSTYEKVHWKIRASASTKILAILVSASSGKALISTTNTKIYEINLPYAYEIENANFKGILARLDEWFGIKAINSFKGEYRLQPKIEIHSIDVPTKEFSLNGIPPRKNQSKFDFDLPQPNMQFAKWSINGPLKLNTDNLPIIADNNFVKIDQKIYRISNHRLEVINLVTQEAHFFEQPSGFPKISEWRDLTVDSTRNLLVFTGYGQGSENFLFRYNPNSGQWVDYLSLKREEISSIYYDAIDDQYIGWQPYARLVLISPSGSILQKKELAGLMPGMDGRSYVNQAYKFKVVSKAKDVAVIAYQGKTVRKIWHYDLDSQEILLTYQLNTNFDCGDAASLVQKWVCSDAGLAQKDLILNQYFNQALTLETEGGTSKSDQILWSMNVLNKCSSLVCLNNNYDERIKYFAKILHLNVSDKIENILNLSAENPGKKLAAGAEVIVISGYEPTNIKSKEIPSIGAGEAGRSKITINRPNSNVILVLTSNDPVTWQVEATPATNLIAIIVGASKQPAVISNVKTIQYVGILSEENRLSYATERNSKNFSNLLVNLNKVLGTEKADAFKGSYTIPQEIRVDALDKISDQLTLSGPEVQKIQNNFKFDLINSKYKRIKWSLTGPVDNSANYYLVRGAALPPRGDEIYHIEGHSMEIINPFLEKPTKLSVPTGFPATSWPNDIAYDTKRNLVALTTSWSDGLLYRYNAINQQWVDFHEYKNISCATLVYDEKTDRYIGWSGGFDSGNLIFISGEGKFLSKLKVSDLLQGFGRLSDRENNEVPTLKIVPNGNEVGLIAMSNGQVDYIWYLNLDTKISALTYKRDSKLMKANESIGPVLINQTINMPLH